MEGGNRQPQEVGGDLGEARLVALAVRLGPEQERDAAIGLEADLGASRAGLEKAGVAEPAQPAASDGFAAAGGKAGVEARRTASSRLSATTNATGSPT